MARYLITSALPYINGIKHLGNLAGSMLPADVHARFRRMQGHEVLYICATDEHGTPAELAAQAAGQSPADYCRDQYQVQKAIYERFRLSFDWFGRSSGAPNHRLTQHFCDRLEDAGLVEERVSEQIYSPADGRFLPDRYVEGTCPECGFERARGDQCDGCGTLLEPVRLIDPRSKVSGATDLEVRETRHLFLLQSKMNDRVRHWVETETDWPHLAKSIALKWLDEGLQDRAITRDLDWGIPVTRNGAPRPGFEDKVFYVWFDAPIEYIGATVEWSEAKGGDCGEDWQRWWRTEQGADDVTYVQFMGKDNVAFHTVSFPITLLGSGEDWKLVDNLKAFNWVTWYGGKFSTSENRGVFMDAAIDLLPGDTWRWKLMVNAPEASDSAFTWEEFQAVVNSDLANVLGNFVNRITRFTGSRFDGQVPDAPPATGPMNGPVDEAAAKLFEEVDWRLAALTAHHEAMEFRKAAAETRAIWAAGNEFLQAAAPWTIIKTDAAAAAYAVRIALNLCRLFATVAAPFMPDTAERILAAIGEHALPDWPNAPAETLLDRLPGGQAIAVPEILFQKLEDDDIAAFRDRFSE